MAQRSLANRIWYRSMRFLLWLSTLLFFRLRVSGTDRIPAEGGALVLCNHQSHLDPVLIGVVFQRRLNFLARETLFRSKPFAWLLRSFDSIPIDRDGSGLSGLKETLRRLKREEMVLIFPEGTRTRDGAVARLQPGFCSLAKRGRVPLLPVALDGAFQAWPRDRKLPKPGKVVVRIGTPIEPEEIADLDDAQIVALVQARIQACFEAAQERRTKNVF
jgi:1-acyl-sn-glycerol-3-phosphate acyltransferase